MSSTTVIVLALMVIAGVCIGAWVYIQTHEEEQAYKKNAETINGLRGQISSLTRQLNEMNTRVYGNGEKITMGARSLVEVRAAIDWLKVEVAKPSKMVVEVPAGIEVKTTRKKAVRKKAPVKKKTPLRKKKKTTRKKVKKASSRTVKKIQSQLSQLSH